jgi:glycosyltransferase involved in cell wall biosynthesis
MLPKVKHQMKNKIKLAIIGSRGYPYVYSGYETFVKELAERLVKKDFSVTVYCHKNLFKSFPKKMNGIDLVYLRTIEKKTLSQFIHSFQAVLHACFSRFDVILVVNPANGPFGLFSKILRKKTAINMDGLEWLRPKWKGLGAKYFYTAAKSATKLYDVIINDSDEMQRIYREEFKCDSTVIAYGANIRHSKNPSLIEKWHLKKNDYYLIVGRLVPDNNADIIAREFCESSSIKKLVIVGDVPYKDDYAQRIKSIEDPRLVFTGYVTDQDELAELYHNCYAYFHGHEFGGTNPAMLKALAYGCAVLALDTAFNREMLKNEEHGLFFTKTPGDIKKLQHKIEENPGLAEELRGKSRNRIIENYTWEKITGQYIELFKNMVSTRKERSK